MAKETKQQKLKLQADKQIDTIEDYQFEPIKGYPMLHWKGKRPFQSTQFYPAQLKETYGTDTNGWINKIFWGDNLQVMSHLLREFRGKVDLIYIDPPFDSKADYKKKIKLRGQQVTNDQNSFEEKQYTDIWSNDEYLQFMYERLIVLKELLSDKGCIYLHCDWHKVHYLKIMMDEIFGQRNLLNEIVWKRTRAAHSDATYFGKVHDTILSFKKGSSANFNAQFTEHGEKYLKRFTKVNPKGRKYMLVPLHGPGQGKPRIFFGEKISPPLGRCWPSQNTIDEYIKKGKVELTSNGTPSKISFLDENLGNPVSDWWDDVIPLNPVANERTNYPTQKPETLLSRIIESSSNEGDVIFDCFMGSGTTQAVAMKLGRRFIGADINLGAVETTTKRLLKIAEELKNQQQQEAKEIDLFSKKKSKGSKAAEPKVAYLSKNNKKNTKANENETDEVALTHYLGFSVYNVNNYDVFRNPVQAKEILKKALEVQPLPNNVLYDGEKDGRMVKIMPVNRIATRADLGELINNFNYKAFDKISDKNPNTAVENLLLVCMGHEPDLAAALQKEVPYSLDIKVVDILRDKSNLEFKRDSEADIEVKKGKLEIKDFFPMNLLQKLSIQKENVENWKELTESVKIDWNYDGSVFEPTEVDIPAKNEMVLGIYEVPDEAGTIKVKITDLLSESFEVEIPAS